MTAHEIFKRTREILCDPAKHTTGAYGRTEEGRAVGATSDRAVQWCFMGAMQKAYWDLADEDALGSGPLDSAIGCASRYCQDHGGITMFNDKLGFDEVSKAIDHLIASTGE